MKDAITSRIKGTVKCVVERVFEGDNTSVTLAAFELSHQADMFAKLLSKESAAYAGAVVVRMCNSNYADTVFVAGKQIKKRDHWAFKVMWLDEAK